MKTMPSAEFRRRYAALEEPVAVTVNGHVIGRWLPGPAERSAEEPRNPVQDRRTAQAKRDEVLRALQRGSAR